MCSITLYLCIFIIQSTLKWFLAEKFVFGFDFDNKMKNKCLVQKSLSPRTVWGRELVLRALWPWCEWKTLLTLNRWSISSSLSDLLQLPLSFTFPQGFLSGRLVCWDEQRRLNFPCAAECLMRPLARLSSDGPGPESRDDAHLRAAYCENKEADNLLQRLSNTLQLRGMKVRTVHRALQKYSHSLSFSDFVTIKPQTYV